MFADNKIYKLIDSRKGELILLGIILLLAALSRFYIASIFHGQSSDEISNVFLARLTFESGLKSYPYLFMWFYYFISALMMFIIKDAFVATRLVSICFGVASIALVYLIARRIFDRRIALLSTVLLLLNPEYTLISSVPLREPVYTFFILLSILSVIKNRFYLGAFFVGMSFLTRMEGFLIGMPYYLIALYVQKTQKKAVKAVIILIMFALFVLFMNLWLEKPFIYLTGTFRNQSADDSTIVQYMYSGLWHLVWRAGNSLLSFIKYMLNLIGPNLIFAILGTWFLIRKKIKTSNAARVFTVCYIAHVCFWITYIFLFGKIVFGFHRYFFPLMPFGMIMLSYGFFKLYQIKKARVLLIILLISNLIAGYLIYYHSVGKAYFLISRANKKLFQASLWIENNIPQNSEYKILMDGIPLFYLYRQSHQFNTIMWSELFNQKQRQFTMDDLLDFIRENKVKYVVWHNDNLTAEPVRSYFKNFEPIEIGSAKFTPVQKFEDLGFMALIYEFEERQIR